MKQIPVLLRLVATCKPIASAMLLTSLFSRLPKGKMMFSKALPGTEERKYVWSLSVSIALSSLGGPTYQGQLLKKWTPYVLWCLPLLLRSFEDHRNICLPCLQLGVDYNMVIIACSNQKARSLEKICINRGRQARICGCLTILRVYQTCIVPCSYYLCTQRSSMTKQCLKFDVAIALQVWIRGQTPLHLQDSTTFMPYQFQIQVQKVLWSQSLDQNQFCVNAVTLHH